MFGDVRRRVLLHCYTDVFPYRRFLVEFNLYSWWYSDLIAKGEKVINKSVNFQLLRINFVLAAQIQKVQPEQRK